MRNRIGSVMLRYSFAVVSIALATWTRILLDAPLGGRQPFITFYVAVLCTAWHGGIGPSLVSLGLGALSADYFFLEPLHSFSVHQRGDQFGLGLFLFVNILSILVLEKTRSVRHQVERAEEAERTQRNLFEVTLNSIGDAVITTNPDGQVTFLNSVAQVLTGWTAQEAHLLPLETIFAIVHETTREPVESPIARVIREGKVVGLAHPAVLIARDGTERPIDNSAAPIQDAGGKFLGVVLTFHDLMEQKRAESAVRESETRKTAILETALDCIITIDHQNRILEFNAAAEKTFGYRRADVLGQSLAERIIPPSFCEAHHQGMAHYLATGEGPVLGKRIEMTALRADGTEFPVELAITRIPMMGPPVFTAYLRDLSERKRAENRRNVRLAVTEVLARSDTLHDAAPGILQATCDSLEWDVGEFWTVDQHAEVLRCEAIWHRPGMDVEGFAVVVQQSTFASGVGIPGRVWATGKPVWIADVRHDTTFSGAKAALEARLHAAFAFPILAGQAVLGVLEFYSREVRASDGDLLDTMTTTGGQIGLFLEQKRAEDALRRSEERFRQLADAMPQIVWTSRPDGYLDYYNERWYEYTGLPRCGGDGAGGDSSWKPILHPDDVQNCLDLWYEAVRTGQPYEIEYRFKEDKTGDYRWHLGRALPVRDESGRIVKWFGTGTDIHDQKRAENALLCAREELEERVLERTADLRQSEERFRKAFNFAAVGMALVGLDGRWLQVNRSLCDLVGYSEEELLELTFQQITHPDDLEADLAHVRQLLAGEINNYQMEKRYFHKDGRVLWILLAVSLVHNEQGQPLHFISQIKDITDRKQAEEESRNAREVAESANRFKSEFLANMSHEIRTPMNGVLGMTDLLLDTDLTARQHDYLTVVRSSATALLDILDDILDFSKIEAGKLELDSRPFRLRDVLADTLRPLAVRAHQKGLEIAYRVAANVPDTLIGDAGRLCQVVVNLVGNAIKFTEQGEIIVQVRNAEGRMQNERDSSDISILHSAFRTLHFEVTDTGVGVAPEKLRAIFEPFTQADSSTTRRFGGTGLGLSISSRLVELMGGRIWAESEPDKGSTFYFTLRCGVSHDPGPIEPSSKLRGLPVLVVGSSATGRDILAEMLSGWHMRPVTVGSVKEALADLQRTADAGAPHRVVLLDAALPEAEELAGLVQGGPEFAGTAIVLIAADGQADAGRWQGLGVTTILNKPPRQSHLLEAIEAVGNSPLSMTVRTIPADVPPRRDVMPEARSLRILVAEDNTVNQLVARVMLQNQGHVVTVANNGREALAALAGQPFDLCFMDVQMPEMDGIEATVVQREREKTTGRHVPIIALTAHAMKGDRERCLAAGMDGYFTKPIRAEDLRQALARAGFGDTPAEPAVAVNNNEAVLDRAELLARVDGSTELVRLVTDIFRSDWPGSRAVLGEALQAGSGADLAKAVHTLKGTLGNLAAREALETARELEAVARSNDLGRAADLLAVLDRQVEQLQAALDDVGGLNRPCNSESSGDWI